MNNDIFVYTMRLPESINEMVTPCIGGYTVWLSDKLDDEHRKKAYRHALAHIANNDFERDDVQTVERIRHES